jgi:hypothetical protein
MSSRHLHVLNAGALALALVVTSCSSSGSGEHATHDTLAPAHTASLRDDMRKLWEDHITWTRNYIIAAEAGSPDTDATATRLLQNQTDIGDAIKPLYGDAAGDQLTAMLKDHILTAADLITAAKANDGDKVTAAKDKWYANADSIADFLAKANPTNWPQSQMRQMMHDHLDITLAEAVDHLNGDYAADIADYDRVHTQILAMADMLTDGIVAQFPEKFA